MFGYFGPPRSHRGPYLEFEHTLNALGKRIVVLMPVWFIKVEILKRASRALGNLRFPRSFRESWTQHQMDASVLQILEHLLSIYDPYLLPLGQGPLNSYKRPTEHPFSAKLQDASTCTDCYHARRKGS